ncbi:helix-turn-helix transcriptional regulator [Nesterenkonia sp. Hz 6-5]|nr:helix-turn-helix transcriptional regulator [Nesterenkonia haasae]
MPPASVLSSQCPSRTLLEHVTSKWGVLIIHALSQSPARWSGLRRAIEGVSEKMLAQTLKTLEADGFIERHDHGTIPPHVEYSLTNAGQDLAGHLLPLLRWIEAHTDAQLIDAAPAT